MEARKDKLEQCEKSAVHLSGVIYNRMLKSKHMRTQPLIHCKSIPAFNSYCLFDHLLS